MRSGFLPISAVVLLALGCGGGVEAPAAQPAGDAGVDAPPPAPQTLVMQGVDLYQTVQVPLMRAGERPAVRNAPIIRDREGIVRVSVKPDLGWTRKKLVATLHLESTSGSSDLKDTREIGPAGSRDYDLGSTFRFDLDKKALQLDTQYSVTITNGDEVLARWPAEGNDTIDAKPSGPLKVKLVPVKWDVDGSGRLPTTSVEMVDSYKNYLYSLYPVTSVEITVREPWSWTEAVNANGDGWDTLLQAIVDLRNTESAPDDVYYYGVFKPADQFWKYCREGCVAGLSGLLSDPRDAFSRGSIGLGYGEESAKTMAHEIGHAHGRAHAPCGGAAGIDRKFPYSEGDIGVFGWDLVDKRLVDPSYSDIMGYCSPNWVSDYTYSALYTRVQFVTKARSYISTESAPIRYRFVNVGRDGKLTWGRSTITRNPPLSDPQTITFEAADGTKQTLTGHWYPYGEMAGGYMVVPEPTIPAVRMTIDTMPTIDKVLSLARP